MNFLIWSQITDNPGLQDQEPMSQSPGPHVSLLPFLLVQ